MTSDSFGVRETSDARKPSGMPFDVGFKLCIACVGRSANGLDDLTLFSENMRLHTSKRPVQIYIIEV